MQHFERGWDKQQHTGISILGNINQWRFSWRFSWRSPWRAPRRSPYNDFDGVIRYRSEKETQKGAWRRRYTTRELVETATHRYQHTRQHPSKEISMQISMEISMEISTEISMEIFILRFLWRDQI